MKDNNIEVHDIKDDIDNLLIVMEIPRELVTKLIKVSSSLDIKSNDFIIESIQYCIDLYEENGYVSK